MFQSYKYGFLSLLGDKSQTFYTLLFPIILGTFFNIAFGSIIKNTENFTQIPVAVVQNTESPESRRFTDVINLMSEGEDALISPQYVSSEQALEMLGSGEIEGIFTADGDISLTVSKQGLNQNILKIISDNYLQITSTVGNIAAKRPDLAQQIVGDIQADITANREISLGTGETDTFVHYYYSLIAMACLFGSYFGSKKVRGIQANLSALAARRCVSPCKKTLIIISDVMAAVSLLFIMILIVIAYLTFVIGVNFGDRWGFVILTGFVGSVLGVSFGTFVTSFSKSDSKTTEGILTGASLTMCFLSGLMVGNMKDIIERSFPILNRINPATLLADAFYCLSVYDNYARYTRNMVSMLIISFIFCAAGAAVLRRKQYANI